MRGASTASRPVSPYSVTPSTTLRTVLMIVRPPGEPVTSTSLAVLQHDGRRHRAEHPLARVDQVGGRADVARRVGVARLLVEVPHLVVEEEAGAFDDDVRAEPAFERVSARDRHAAPIEDREVRRLVGLGALRGDDVRARARGCWRPCPGRSSSETCFACSFDVSSATGTVTKSGSPS